MLYIVRERCEVIACEREEEKLNISLQKQKYDDAPKGKLPQEDGYPVIGKQPECKAIAEEGEQDERYIEQEILYVRLEESLAILLNVNKSRNAVIGLVVDDLLNTIEIKPQILLTDTIADNLKPIVDGVVDFLKDELHVRPILSIVVDVE